MQIILNSSGQRVDCAIACRVFLAMYKREANYKQTVFQSMLLPGNGIKTKRSFEHKL